MEGFVNHYEVLGLAPVASAEAIAAHFRALARRYHPDNVRSGDRQRFEAVLRAHDILKDAGKRAQYHSENDSHLPPLSASSTDEGHTSQSPSEGHAEPLVDGLGIARDAIVQDSLLTMLYLQRRRNTKEPGIGNAELERLSGCPHEHLEFHI